MATGYITHRVFCETECPYGHPESAARVGAIEDRLRITGIFDFLRQYDAPTVSMAQLTRIHTPEHARYIMDHVPSRAYFEIDGDTFLGRRSGECALRAAGAVVKAVDLVTSGESLSVFCNVRPPGHHASANESTGFCIFNNVAVGVGHALEAHGLERVAVVDFDVHYGNGTHDIFRNDPRVTICSTYEKGLYPFINAPVHDNGDISIGLPPVGFAKHFRQGVATYWLPHLAQFRPQMVFVSAGFDAHIEDDISHADLTEADFRWVTEQIVELANEYAQGRIVSVLEGGYDLSALGRSAAIHVQTLMGIQQ